MFLVNWFKKALYLLPLSRKEASILFIGPDYSGKGAIIKRLSGESLIPAGPTAREECKEAQIGRVYFRAFNPHGQETMKKICGQYFRGWKGIAHRVDTADHECGVNGIVYVVDAADHECVGISRDELQELLNDSRLNEVPILVFGNNIDKPKALPERELLSELRLANEDGSKAMRKNVELFMCSAMRNSGILEGFEWLSEQV